MREFLTGATRNLEDEKLDYEGFISPFSMRAFAEYMHSRRLQADGTIRSSDNWQKGMSRASFMRSLARHFFDLWRTWRETQGIPGVHTISQLDKIIELLCAMLFNIQGLLHEIMIGRDVEDKATTSPNS